MEAFSFPSTSSLNSQSITPTTREIDFNQEQQCVQNRAPKDGKQSGTTKPKQSKSRNGCSTCKAKRLKCDEGKPICQQCIKRKVTCGGYKKDFKWRAFADASPRTSVSAPNDKGGLHEIGSEPPTSPSFSDQASTPIRHPETPRTLSASVRKSSSLASELTFPTAEQLLAQPLGNSTIIKHESYDDLEDYTRKSQSQRHGTGNHNDLSVSSDSVYAESSTNDGIEEIPRRDFTGGCDEFIRALSSSSSSSSGLNFSFAFNQPKLATSSPEMLALNYNTNTCGILSVKDGMTENPWRTHLWPMAKHSPALFHAISSLSAFHCARSDPQMKLAGMQHMSQSITQLYKNMNKMSIEQSLATSITLALADTWDTSISLGIEHVRGSSVLISHALTKMKNSQSQKTSTLRFLCKTWLYIDVLSRLTSNHADDTDVDCPIWSQIDLLSNSDEIDPLLGCASTLFPIIGRIANLVSKVRKTRQNSISMISQANELKQELLNWSPPSYLQKPEDPTCDIQHSIQTAEAYQWATMLHLHQAVPEIPSRSAETLAQKVLLRLATVPIQSRTVIVHIYPLLAASCEASSADDRAWVIERWTQMQRRMQISNIDRCVEVVKEVWNRRDKALLQSPREQTSEQSHTIMFDQSVGVDAVMVPSPIMQQNYRRGSFEVLQRLPFERTVRGSQHWAGIMQELGWEVLLG